MCYVIYYYFFLKISVLNDLASQSVCVHSISSIYVDCPIVYSTYTSQAQYEGAVEGHTACRPSTKKTPFYEISTKLFFKSDIQIKI